MVFKDIVSHFKVKERSGDSVKCLCPHHADKEASLSITLDSKTGKTLLNCHAGCNTEDILQDVGLKMSDLFQENRNGGWISYIENVITKAKGNSFRYVDRYDYSDIHGKYLFSKVRLQDANGKKEIRYGIIDDEKGRIELSIKKVYGKSVKNLGGLYGDLGKIRQAITNGASVFYCEGEKDVNSMTEKGYTAFTLGGADDWRSDFAGYLKNAKLIILQDNDEAGEKLSKQIYHDVYEIAQSIRVIIPIPDTPNADISDFFKDHDKEDFEKLLSEAVDPSWMNEPEDQDNQGNSESWKNSLEMDDKGEKLLNNLHKLHDEGAKAQTVLEWERPIPFEQVELPEFPVEALPERARGYVEAVAEALQVPVDMPGTAALAVMACCTQGKYYVEPKPNWTEPVNLYAVIIAEPAERKSAVTSLMTKPIKNYESNYNASHAEDIAANQGKKRILQKEKDNLERLLADPKKEHTYEQEQRYDEVVKEFAAFEEMSFLRLYVDDVTPEALTLFMDQNGGCASILSAEGGIFDQLTGGMYSKTVNIDVFLKAHAGDSIRVDRITRSCNTINNPALTMLLAIQPNVLCGLMQNETFRGRGLTARFLYTMPKTLVGKRQYHTAEIPISARLDYEGMVENLLSEYLNPTTENPAKITLSANASEKLEGFFMELEPQLQNEFNNFSEWAGKLCGAVVRIAGLLCRADAKRNELQDDSFTLEVDGETMTRAVALGRYYLKHAEAAFLLMGADPIVKRCEYVLQAIKKEGKAELSQRDIMRLCRSFKKKDELIPVLDRLCEYGYLRPKGETEKRTGRPVSQQYEINPAVITQNS